MIIQNDERVTIELKEPVEVILAAAFSNFFLGHGEKFLEVWEDLHALRMVCDFDIRLAFWAVCLGIINRPHAVVVSIRFEEV